MSDNERLKKMMDEAKSSTTGSDVKKSIASKQTTHKRWPWYAGGATVVLLSAGLFFALPRFSNTQHFDDNTRVAKVDADKDSPVDALGSLESPIALEKWQKVSYSMQRNSNPKKLKKEIVEWSDKSSSIYSEAGNWVSEEGGFFDDMYRAKQKNGLVDPHYSYLTKENIEYAYTSIVTRLINPYFGGWNQLQMSDTHAKSSVLNNQFKEMFTERWWKENINEGKGKTEADYRKLPIYADWNSDNYGGQKFATPNVRWMGSIDKESIRYTPGKEVNTGTFNVSVDFTYSAKMRGGAINRKKGNLKLSLIKNTSNETNPEYRLLVDSAQLTVN